VTKVLPDAKPGALTLFRNSGFRGMRMHFRTFSQRDFHEGQGGLCCSAIPSPVAKSSKRNPKIKHFCCHCTANVFKLGHSKSELHFDFRLLSSKRAGSPTDGDRTLEYHVPSRGQEAIGSYVSTRPGLSREWGCFRDMSPLKGRCHKIKCKKSLMDQLGVV
jgi:hypothetical protein